MDEREQILLRIAPRIKEQCPDTPLALGPDAGFVFAHIDGSTPAGVLAEVMALDASLVARQLLELESMGLVEWSKRASETPETSGALVRAKHTPSKTVDAASVPSQKKPKQPKKDATTVFDLSLDEQQDIERAEQGFESKDYWEIFGLDETSKVSDIKRAYFTFSKKYHPDRFFGRELGPFATRLDILFQKIQRAYETLKNEERKQEYARLHPPPARDASKIHLDKRDAAQTDAQTRPQQTNKEDTYTKEQRLEQRRKKIKQQRHGKPLHRVWARPKAFGGDREKAEQMFAQGLEQLRQGAVAIASASFKLATIYDPNNQKYRELFEQSKEQSLLQRAVQMAHSAESAMAEGNVAQAAEILMRAFELAPQKTDYALRAAEHLAALGQMRDALHLATQAIEIAPNRLEPRLAIIGLLCSVGRHEQAKNHLEKAVSLDSEDGRVKRLCVQLGRKK